MPGHFLGLQRANTLVTGQYQLASRIIDDLVARAATGVIHGPAGFVVEANLERLRDAGAHRVSICSLAFPSKPTMLRVAAELFTALTGTVPPTSRSRFYLISHLLGLLTGPPRLVVVDEAHRLNGECIELLRHLDSRCCARGSSASCHSSGGPRTRSDVPVLPLSASYRRQRSSCRVRDCGGWVTASIL